MAQETQKEMKPTYEQLESVANQLAARNRRLEDALRDSRFAEVSARLNFLFRVVELSDKFPGDYLNECVDEIQRILPTTIDGEEQEGQEQENDGRPKGPYAVKPEGDGE